MSKAYRIFDRHDRVPPSDGKAQSLFSVSRELVYIDILGSLVPGLFTIILGTTMVVLAVTALYVIIFNAAAPGSLDSYWKMVEPAHYEIAVITLVSAYVIGTAFFRQDPKHPDALSAVQVWLSAKPEERPGLAVQMTAHEPVDGRFWCDDEWLFRHIGFWPAYLCLKYHKRQLDKLDTQFPYRFMRCYLAARGLDHLIAHIPWCPKNEKTTGNRTKMFINILKIRIAGLAPAFGRDIVRNEAHVRLATSVWYAATTLFRLGTACLFAIFVGAGAAPYFGHHPVDPLSLYEALFGTVMVILVVIVLCWAMKHQLRRCIHYMRVREVVYVLEAAHLAEELCPGFDLSDVAGSVPIKDTCAGCERIEVIRHAHAKPGQGALTTAGAPAAL